MIPRKIHFIYGLEENFGGKEFGFVHWAAIKSAKKINPDYELFFYYKYLPENYYFDDVRGDLQLVKLEPPVEIFGNKLHHVAHKTDVMRLVLLHEYGGIYLDIDTICVKPFDDLLEHACVMGAEALDGKETHGLCNAVILAEEKAKFILAWYEEFKSFRSVGRDQYWAEHAVTVPLQVSKRMPEDVTILPREAFFYPTWEKSGLKMMFREKHRFPNAHVHHLWEGGSWGALRQTNELNCFKLNDSYGLILESVIADEIGRLAGGKSGMGPGAT